MTTDYPTPHQYTDRRKTILESDSGLEARFHLGGSQQLEGHIETVCERQQIFWVIDKVGRRQIIDMLDVTDWKPLGR